MRSNDIDAKRKRAREDVIVKYKEKICSHMVRSDLALVTKVSHIKNYARMVALRGMNDAALRWYTHLLRIALSIDLYQHDIFLSFYVDISSSGKVVPHNDATNIEEHPTRRNLLCRKSLKIIVPSTVFTAIVSQITSSSEPGKGSAMLISGWLIELGNVYVASGMSVLAFNVAQITLMYMDAATVPIHMIKRLSLICFGNSVYRHVGKFYVRKALEGMSTNELYLVRKAYRLACMALKKLVKEEESSCERMYIWAKMAQEESTSMFRIKKKNSEGLKRRNSSSDDGVTFLSDQKQRKRSNGGMKKKTKKKGRMTFRPL